MSSEWADAAAEQDAYTRMWDVEDDWGFDDLPADNWTVWDEPPNADHTLNDYDPYYGDSSSTVDGFTPPRPAQDLAGERERYTQAHDSFGPTSLAPMGNTASRPSRPELPTSQQTSAHQPASTRPRAPAADHSEDWRENRGVNGGQSSFGYIPDHLFETLSESPERSPPHHSSHEQITNTMPATTRRRQRGSIVDLTTDHSSPQIQRAPKSLKRAAEEAEESRSTKKSKKSPQHVDELDLTEEAPSVEEELRQAQQEKAIAAQQAEQENSGPLKIGQRQCIICMENYTNATVTHCGHIYCHECLTQALKAGEKNSDRGVGNCPVCRKPISRKKASQMVPVAFMKKAAFKGKSRKDMGLLG